MGWIRTGLRPDCPWSAADSGRQRGFQEADRRGGECCCSTESHILIPSARASPSPAGGATAKLLRSPACSGTDWRVNNSDRVSACAANRIEFLPPVLTSNERGRFSRCTTEVHHSDDQNGILSDARGVKPARSKDRISQSASQQGYCGLAGRPTSDEAVRDATSNSCSIL